MTLFDLSPAARAAHAGDVKGLAVILKDNPQLIDVKDELQETLLYCAAFRGHPEVIKLLVDLGSKSIDEPNDEAIIPLFAASAFGYDSTIEMLLRLGSKAINVCLRHRSALSIAASNGKSSTVETLVKFGASLIGEPYVSGVGAMQTLLYLALPFENGASSRDPMPDYDEYKAEEVRYRVYFQRSLIDCVLFQLDVLHYTSTECKSRVLRQD